MRRRRRRRKQSQTQQPAVRRTPQPKRNQFVVPHAEGWAVKKEGSKRATAVFYTQEEAIKYGRSVAINQRCELVIHDRNGNVRKRRNYKSPRYPRPFRYSSYFRELQASYTPPEPLLHSSEHTSDN